MDLVTCEAPLDNSFQKDRRELVNKGSLGRRRKPSRSNLKVILSPTSDQLDTFNSLHNGELEDISGCVQENGTSRDETATRSEELATTVQNHAKVLNGNHLQSVKSVESQLKVRASSHFQTVKSVDSQLKVATDNYKNVVASINKLQRVSSDDSNFERRINGDNKPLKVNGKDYSFHKGEDNENELKVNGDNCNFQRVKTEDTKFFRVNGDACNFRIVNGENGDFQRVKSEDNRFSKVNGEGCNFRRVNGENGNSQRVTSEDNKSPRVNGEIFNFHRGKSEDYKLNKVDGENINSQRVNCQYYKFRTASGDNNNNNNNCNKISATNNYRTKSPNDDQAIKVIKQKLSVSSENNNLSSKCYPQVTVIKNRQNSQYSKSQDRVIDGRSNGFSKFDSNQNSPTARNQNVPRSANHQHTLNVQTQQRSVESRNQQHVITFSNSRKIITSTPVQSQKNIGTSDRLQGDKDSTLFIEPSLPRTSDKPNLVAEAQQFSVEAKLRRKKAEAQGRSAVLIQTWERRTQSSDPRGDSSKTSQKNWFGGKDNCSSAMPDSYICSKYKGSLENGQKTDDLLPRVRDASSSEAMLYRVTDNRFAGSQPSWTPNGKMAANVKSSVQEPEWISLSRKLCAKFVEGHIESNSPDSYLQEEPEGVVKSLPSPKQRPRTQSLPSPIPKDSVPKAHSGDSHHPTPKEIAKIKTVVSAPDDADNGTYDSSGPPWIHLSRKLCNKFIEEHIEYPPITNGHFVEIPELVEPNGDVRIIEKVGKPKGRKSKQKDCQPEWVSLSKKLRAKFIESHIDDPETIALDNQLNASDPEESSSTESFSDVSQEVTSRERDRRIATAGYKDYARRHDAKADVMYLENSDQFQKNDSTVFPEKECCWEYQEMEFDQESNSGTFQEAEYSDEPLQEVRIRRGSLPADTSDHPGLREAFNSKYPDFEAPECFNNDVQFAPHLINAGHCANNLQQNQSRSSNSFQLNVSRCVDSHQQNRHIPDSLQQNQPIPSSNLQQIEYRSSNSFQQNQSVSSNNLEQLQPRSSIGLQQNQHNSSGSFQPNQFGSSNNLQQNKHITVQFIARTNDNPGCHPIKDLGNKNNLKTIKQSAIHGSFFNLSTWEEAHYKDGNPRERLNYKKESLNRELRSKSLDNLFDSLDTELVVNDDGGKKGDNSVKSFPKEDCISKAEGQINEEEAEIFFDQFDPDPQNIGKNVTSRNTNYDGVEINREAGNSVNIPSQSQVNNSNSSKSDSRIENSTESRAKNINSNKCQIMKLNGGEIFYMDQNESEIQNKNSSTCQVNKQISSGMTFMDGYIDSVNEELSESEKRKKNVDKCPVKAQNYGKISVSNKYVDTFSEERLSDSENRKKSSNKTEVKTQNSNKICLTNYYTDGVSADQLGQTETKKKNLTKCQEKNENPVSKSHDVESSSDDEIFNSTSKNRNSSQDASHYGKISSQRISDTENENKSRRQISDEKLTHDKLRGNNEHIKCNGMIPNSIYSGLPENKISPFSHRKDENTFENNQKETPKMGMSKWITISKSEQNVNKSGISNLAPHSNKMQKSERRSSEINCDLKEVKLEKRHFEKRYSDDKTSTSSNGYISPQNFRRQHRNEYASPFDEDGGNEDVFGPVKEFDIRNRCKSLCDISFNNSNNSHDEHNFRHHESVADLAPASKSQNFEFQHFKYEAEIPLCAKLVSSQDRNKSSKNIQYVSSTNRTDSPCPSETSHVYEDMFKETPSGPSDSEASSWTAMKNNNSYYVNGRSSSMNDLDYSDSCSMSVKCDYASSSENSTLQSRHSSYASSSFYVNLRDYDSHMLEPSLNKPKRNDGKVTSNGNPAMASKSNPPTPESLRHLFTSPLSSIQSPVNRTSRLISRMPSDPQSHYYSTASAATSSAFKHGFAPTTPKPKKTERSSSIKIKDIAHGIILTFKRFQNHSKNSNVSSTHYVDVSHLAEMNTSHKSEPEKSKKNGKDIRRDNQDKGYWTENCKTDTDSGFLSDVQRAKARRSSSDVTELKSNVEVLEKKKNKSAKKNSREKGKKSRTKVSEPRPIPTVSRKVQQGADGTLYLVTTVSGDTTALPGVYSDSPDTSSELSSHCPVKVPGESNC